MIKILEATITINDQKIDTYDEYLSNHKKIVEDKILHLADILKDRGLHHDDDKFTGELYSTYAEAYPLLKNHKYGTPEQQKAYDELLGDVKKIHSSHNPHHPGYYENGVNGMTLIDVMEMLCDWYSASQVNGNGFEDAFNFNCNRDGIEKQLADILANTYRLFIKEDKQND